MNYCSHTITSRNDKNFCKHFYPLSILSQNMRYGDQWLFCVSCRVIFCWYLEKSRALTFLWWFSTGRQKVADFLARGKKVRVAWCRRRKLYCVAALCNFCNFPSTASGHCRRLGPGRKRWKSSLPLHTVWLLSWRENRWRGERERDEGLVGRSAGRCECEPAAVRSQSADWDLAKHRKPWHNKPTAHSPLCESFQKIRRWVSFVWALTPIDLNWS